MSRETIDKELDKAFTMLPWNKAQHAIREVVNQLLQEIERKDSVEKTIERAIEREWNPFEPSNQSERYKRLQAAKLAMLVSPDQPVAYMVRSRSANHRAFQDHRFQALDMLHSSWAPDDAEMMELMPGRVITKRGGPQC